MYINTKNNNNLIRTWPVAVDPTHHPPAVQAGVCWTSPTSTSTTARSTRWQSTSEGKWKWKISGLRPVHPLGSSASTRCHGRHCCSWGPRQGEIRGTKIHKYKNKKNTNTNTLRPIAVWVGCCEFKCQDWCLTVSVTLEGLGGVCLSECLCVWRVSQWVWLTYNQCLH